MPTALAGPSLYCFSSFSLLKRRPDLFKDFLVSLHKQRVIGPCSNVLARGDIGVVWNVLDENYLCRVSTDKPDQWSDRVSDVNDFSELSGNARIDLVDGGGYPYLCASLCSFFWNLRVGLGDPYQSVGACGA